MSNATILFADNNAEFAEIRSEVLKGHGYQVVLAFDPAQAIEVANGGEIDLAILDLRLTSDYDEKDRSGLAVAKAIDPAIPKIILTAYPAIDTARMALFPTLNAPPLAADFLSKSEGPQAMLSSIEHVLLSRSVTIQLTLDRDLDSFSTDDQKDFLDALRNLLYLSSDIQLIRIERGSTRLIIELTREQAEQLLWLYRRGVLDGLKVKDAKVIGSAIAAAIIEDKVQNGNYDVFMCHHSEDKPQIKQVALRLRSRGILPWLDEWELRPGLPWQRALEVQIAKINSAAVFVGNSGLGPWQCMELDAFIRQFVQRQCPVIPVILHTCKSTPALPLFLDGMGWVDFKKRKPDPYDQLIWGITGKRRNTL